MDWITVLLVVVGNGVLVGIAFGLLRGQVHALQTEITLLRENSRRELDVMRSEQSELRARLDAFHNGRH